MEWHTGKNYGDRYLYQNVPLSNGQKLHLGFALRDGWRYDDEVTVEPRMVCYRGPYRFRWGFRQYKQGRAIGPGGLEVLKLAIPVMRAAESEVLKRTDKPYVTMEVCAATPRLFKVYERFLRTSGYVVSEGWEEDESYLFKNLRRAGVDELDHYPLGS